MVKISNRLMTAASLVTAQHVLADVGTDHGYVPIFLMEQKKIPKAIAMDIGAGPLQRAKEHIALYGLGDYIETRLSDGVEALAPGEVDTILIAGMGGGLVMHILSDGQAVCRQAKELILQPQSEIEKVREFLETEGYEVLAEDMVLEDEKFYPMMKVRYAGTTAEQKQPVLQDVMNIHSTMTDVQLLKISHVYGGLLLKNQHPVLKTYLEKEQKLYLEIRENLKSQKASEKIQTRLEEVEEILKYNALALSIWNN